MQTDLTRKLVIAPKAVDTGSLIYLTNPISLLTITNERWTPSSTNGVLFVVLIKESGVVRLPFPAGDRISGCRLNMIGPFPPGVVSYIESLIVPWVLLLCMWLVGLRGHASNLLLIESDSWMLHVHSADMRDSGAQIRCRGYSLATEPGTINRTCRGNQGDREIAIFAASRALTSCTLSASRAFFPPFLFSFFNVFTWVIRYWKFYPVRKRNRVNTWRIPE